jgi:hypothetical protein
MKRHHWLLGSLILICLFVYATELFADDKEAVKAFDTVQKVFQSPDARTATFPETPPCSSTPGYPMR